MQSWKEVGHSIKGYTHIEHTEHNQLQRNS